MLKNRSRNFLAAIGLTLEEVEKLLSAFQVACDSLYPHTLTRTGNPRQRRASGGATGVLHSYPDKLLFNLVNKKTNPL